MTPLLYFLSLCSGCKNDKKVNSGSTKKAIKKRQKIRQKTKEATKKRKKNKKKSQNSTKQKGTKCGIGEKQRQKMAKNTLKRR